MRDIARRSLRRVPVALLLVSGALATACTAEAPADPGNASRADGSPSALADPPTPSASAADPVPSPAATDTVPSPPAGTDDRQGRVAFARYVLQAWIHALNTNDAAPLDQVSGRTPCDGCSELAAELESRSAEGWRVRLEGVRVSAVRVSSAADRSRVTMRVAIPESDTFHADGSFRSRNQAHPRATFEVEMDWSHGAFVLRSFSLY